MSEVSSAPQPDSKAASAPKLDDLMLAMDVVDTLRHQEQLVAKELDQNTRDDELKKRLREIYEGQGLEVSDRIVEEGIKALRESRFTYVPKGSGWKRSIAMLWVKRGWTTAITASILLIAVLLAGNTLWQAASQRQAAEVRRIELTDELPKALRAAREAAASEAQSEEARAAINRIAGFGENAIRTADAETARQAVTALKDLQNRLITIYDIAIVQSGQSGVFRIPDVNTQARNFYLVVEAVTPGGEKLSLPVRNEETNKTESVSRWGIRVPEETYLAIRNDKEDDGIIQHRILGRKMRGVLQPVYNMPVSGGAITKW